MRFSIRSLLLVTAGVAVLCTLYTFIPHIDFVVPIIVYFFAWTVPGASIGFDIYPSRRGMMLGAVVGASLGGVLFLWIMIFIPRE